MDSWTAPDFLSDQAGQDYLASLASFLDNSKSDIAVPYLNPQTALAPLGSANDPSSPEDLTSDSASPASSDGANSTSAATASGSTATAPPPLTASRGRRSSPVRSTPAGTSTPAPAHDKRKNGASAAGAVKDRKGANQAQGHHSHPTGEDGEFARSESPEDGKGNKGKTSERRKAQNRQAQRNFRERKEKHLKELEERVVSLEQRTQDQDAENAALKQLLENLQNENERLKVYESTFTFDYTKDVSGSNAMPQAPSFKPPSPPVSQDGLDEGNSSFKFDTASLLGASTSSLSGAPLFATAPAYSLPPSTSSLSSSTSAAAAPGLATATSLDDPLFLGAFSASPASGVSAQSPLAPGPSPGTSTDLFMAYRDPLAELGTQPAPLSTFSDFDALFASTPMPPAPAAAASSGARSLASTTGTNTAPTSPEDPLAAYFNASPSPLGGPPSSSTGTAPSPGSFFTGGLAPRVGSASASPAAANVRAYEAGCPLLTGGDKYEFDVDGLCSEMKLKATCQEAARQALKSAMAEDAAASRKAYPSQL
ncbi:hypothetical protein JCM3775_001507 [Rhodotorula graminis]|uniref:BZIP domain-containing protein n=1 Tax=Rhodotorula graminis (strain WP1) TaxID=578459 RepID=A0A0P9EWQ6_RHOGW|nr:uncharacterized protein RHOBADRAFT_54946 [Rhodotorula graminis WP1]KPV73764.1 hypothetical protein RHOBADRAFT_54946 [Rhodotorula graminis WP1]